MIWTDNMTGHPRMGLIVPKFQSSAVARNRLRRRLREIWRREVQQHQPAWDLVIRARREAYGAPFDAAPGRAARLAPRGAGGRVSRGGAPRCSPAGLLAALIRGYQLALSPLLPPSCRFHPSCSQYALEAVTRHGALEGGWLAARRLARCHPFHPGGYDPVP